MSVNPMQVSWRNRLRLVAFEAGLFLFAAVLIGAATAFARAATTPLVTEVVVATEASLEATRAQLTRATEVLKYASKYRISR